MITLLPDGVFDSLTGTINTDRAVVIEGDRIAAVIPADQASSDATPLPGYLLPGLVDVHTHLVGQVESGHGYGFLVDSDPEEEMQAGVTNARLTLEAGFTTVRDVGTFWAFTDLALRDDIDRGAVPGPRMMCAGAYVTCPGGGGDLTGLDPATDARVNPQLRVGVARGVKQAEEAVRRIIDGGADLIKVIATGAVLTTGTDPGAPEFSQEELDAIVRTADKAGVHVAAHAHGAEGIKRAVRAGARSIEHGSMLDDEAIDLMVEHGTWLVADLYDGDYILEAGAREGWSDETMEKCRATTDSQRIGFRKAVDAGVRIAYGTDAGVYPHGWNGKQFRHYAEHGLTPAQAIQSATRWAAELMGREDRVGSVMPGAFADLVLVENDPADLATLERPLAVMKGGEWVVGT